MLDLTEFTVMHAILDNTLSSTTRYDMQVTQRVSSIPAALA